MYRYNALGKSNLYCVLCTIPVNIEIVFRFVPQYGTEVEAAFIHEKLDQLSVKKPKRYVHRWKEKQESDMDSFI